MTEPASHSTTSSPHQTGEATDDATSTARPGPRSTGTARAREGKLSARDRITERLRTDVLAGVLPPDEPIREVALAERFGVSRGPVRDALLQLSQEGILVAEPNCGMRVRGSASEQDRKLLTKLRADIEVHAMKMAWDELDPDTIDHWCGLADELADACKQRDLARIVRTDLEFHRDLVSRGGQDLVEIWQPITVRMRLRYSAHHEIGTIAEEHAAIALAIGRGDQKQAERILRAHIAFGNKCEEPLALGW